MRLLLALIPLLLSNVAVGATFRVAKFGAPCAAIPDQEMALGSERAPLNNESSASFGFKTELFGEEVTVVYLCKDGLLFTENYFFPKRVPAESLRDFRKAYDEFSSRYGQAFIDNTPWQADANPRMIEENPLRYYVTWRSPELRVTIALMPHNEDANAKRHVFVIVSGDRQ